MGPWHCGDFRYIFLPKIGEDQKRVLPSEGGTPCNVPYYGKSRPSYCITFIERLDEPLRLQVLGHNPLIFPGLYIKIGRQKFE